MTATMEAAMFIMFNMHACVCTCACMCACARVCGGGAPTQPHPTHPPPEGIPTQISKKHNKT